MQPFGCSSSQHHSCTLDHGAMIRACWGREAQRGPSSLARCAVPRKKAGIIATSASLQLAGDMLD